MTPPEIIADARIPGTSIFVLGSFEKRVTVYAQQVRALNLVDAILSENLVRPNGKVAIIGGGAAGITSAVALAKALPTLELLDLFESRPNVLELQRSSTRYLHPHFYDWPTALSNDVDAGLPIMDWRAGPAGQVAETLRAQFEATRRTSVLHPLASHAVSELVPSDLGPTRVIVPGSTAVRRIYDIVILAIGFGLERFLDGETPSYWTPSGLAGPIHIQAPNPLLFVSGNGDGGLVDFMMAAFNALDHQQICQMLMDLDLGLARDELETIELEAWQAGADVDLLAEYTGRLRHLIPPATWNDITDNLRQNVRIILHTKEARLLRRTTALHNRLGVFLILEADRQLNPSLITVHVGEDFVGDVPMRSEITINGVAPFTPHRRFLRLGADTETNLAPFSALLATYPGALTPRASETRPASPLLSASAQARFAPFAVPAPPVAAAAGGRAAPLPAAAANSVTITLTVGAGGTIIWSGDVGPDAIGAIWANGQAVSILCNIDAATAASLMAAIARLGAHASGFNIRSSDAAGWRAGMAGLCCAKALPGPNFQIDCGVNDLGVIPESDPVIEAAPAHIAALMHDALDIQLLGALHLALFDLLGPAAVPMGWPIEPALRVKLWATWEQWHAVLVADPATRRRFLRLLATEIDDVDPSDSLLVRLGPKIIRPHLTDPGIFALTFALCSGHALAPAQAHPGNIASDVLTGHSCGIGWINQRQLGTRSLSQQVWTTGVVLLSQLRAAFQMFEGDTRMDRDFTDSARVGIIALSEEPLIIGADENFVAALEAGEADVQHYFGSIFRWRSNAASRALEEVYNGDA